MSLQVFLNFIYFFIGNFKKESEIKDSVKENKKNGKEKVKNESSILSKELTKSQSSEDKRNDEEIQKNREKLAQRFHEKKPTKEQEKLIPNAEINAKKVKEKTQWTMPKEIISARDMKQLDNSKACDKNDVIEAEDKLYREKYLGGEEEKLEGFLNSDESDDSEDEIKEVKTKSKSLFSKLTDGFKSFTGNKTITNQDIESLLVKFKEDLMHKNVAEEISQKLCDSIKTSLIDKKTQVFTSLKKTVKNCLEEALTKILTPKKNINLISEAMKAREAGKPYVLAFIGVNGVGKSTNLAKIAYLFRTQGFSVMLAACDNFRAGAVEQIKTHGRCLDIPVYDRGYKEDPAEIAQKAIREVSK